MAEIGVFRSGLEVYKSDRKGLITGNKSGFKSDFFGGWPTRSQGRKFF